MQEKRILKPRFNLCKKKKERETDKVALGMYWKVAFLGVEGFCGNLT